MRLAFDARHRDGRTPSTCWLTPKGRADRTVVVGGHLDSVPEGPGINDNGSGIASILETAREDGRTPESIRPTGFDSHSGAVKKTDSSGRTTTCRSWPGSRSRITRVNLNFDMVGSPNAVRFVYDGDGDAFGTAGTDRVERGRRRVPRLLRVARTGDGADRRSTDAPTTSDSSRTASLREGCSPEPTTGRPPRKRPIYGGTAGGGVRQVLPRGVRRHRRTSTRGCSSRWRTPSPIRR